MIKAVIFDMDGLMFDTERLGKILWNEYSEKFNQPIISEIHDMCMGTNVEYQRTIFEEKLGKEFDYDSFIDYIWDMRVQTVKENGVPKKEGLDELIAFLRYNRIKIAVATSTAYNAAIENLKIAEVFDLFDAVVTGDMVKNSKPNPDIYLLACSELGVNPEEAIGLEDSFNGVKAVYNAGMKCVMIPDLVEPDEEILKLCYKKADNLFEIIELIKEENKWSI